MYSMQVMFDPTDSYLDMLRSNNISVDDINFIVQFDDPIILELITNIDNETLYQPKDWKLENLFAQSYQTLWFKVPVNDKETAIAISYHG